MLCYEPISPETRPMVNAFLNAQWGGSTMILRGEVVDMTGVDGYCAFEEGALVGIATYRMLRPDTAEMLSLDSLRPGRGIGTALTELVAKAAQAAGCKRLVLITTNDNLRALGFYQTHGFDIIALHRNTMDTVRAQKPDVPLIGENGIPLRHEIELERLL